MNEPLSIPAPAEFKDRSTGLVVFGILTGLLGALCGAFVPLMFWAQSLAASNGVQGNPAAMVPAMLVYGGMAVALVWLGIGSILARRWARALMLVFSWSWLVMGIAGLGMLLFLVPRILSGISLAQGQGAGQAAAPMPPVALILAIQALVFGFLFVVLPVLWICFYRSPHVKATCAARHPAPCWTDACPLPVLGLALWLGFGAVTMLAMPLAYRGIFPFFGVFLSGAVGSAGWIVLAACWGYSARGLYRLRTDGWWLAVASLVLLMASNAVTYTRHSIRELYERMGYPEEQLRVMDQMNLLDGGLMAWASVGFMLPVLGYLLYVRRFLRAAPPTPAPIPGNVP